MHGNMNVKKNGDYYYYYYLLTDTASHPRRPRCENFSSSNEFILNYSTHIIYFNIIFPLCFNLSYNSFNDD